MCFNFQASDYGLLFHYFVLHNYIKSKHYASLYSRYKRHETKHILNTRHFYWILGYGLCEPSETSIQTIVVFPFTPDWFSFPNFYHEPNEIEEEILKICLINEKWKTIKAMRDVNRYVNIIFISNSEHFDFLKICK